MISYKPAACSLSSSTQLPGRSVTGSSRHPEAKNPQNLLFTTSSNRRSTRHGTRQSAQARATLYGIAEKISRTVSCSLPVNKYSSCRKGSTLSILLSCPRVPSRNMSPTTRPPSLLTLLALLAVWLPSAASLPQLLIESGKAKCVQVSIPASTQIRVEYEAPGR